MTRVWNEHLADISRALSIIEKAHKDLNATLPQEVPGHYSDLQFVFPRHVDIRADGISTGWAIVWDDEMEGWVADFGDAE